MTESRLPLHLLPATLREIAEYCGETVMWTIWRHYGGGHLSVPKNPGPEHKLSELLGIAEARKFCEIYGGDILTIAKAQAAQRAVRDALIRQERLELDLFSLARKYGLTERQVMTICNKAAEPLPQFDLFED